jgi:hypothetical protein
MSYRLIDLDTRSQILRDTRRHKVIAQDYKVHKDTVGRLKRQAQWEQTSNGRIIQEDRTK